MTTDSVQLAKENKNNPHFTAQDATREGEALIARSAIALVGSINPQGFPCIKAMLKMETEGIKSAWFSTNTSSKRVAQFLSNPKASVYFVDEQNFKGLLLVGEMQVLQDKKSKKRLWREGFEVYYPQGVSDPDYTVLCFTAKTANYYHGLQNITFDV